MSKDHYDVIVCGSLHLDIMVHAPALPKIDETAVGSAWRQVCGGKGGNQAVQAAGHGVRTAMIGSVGQDGFGETLLANLSSKGVNCDQISHDSQNGSGMSVAILQDNGEYGAVIVSGANLSLETHKISNSWQALGHARVLILQNEIPPAANVAAATVAKSSGACVILNAAPARALDEQLVKLVDVLVVNRVEAEAMSGNSVTDRVSARAALPALGKLQRSIIVTLGGAGIVACDKEGKVFEIEALPVKVTSTHGAGDCFVGVLAAELARSKNLEEACRVANTEAAKHVSRIEN
jgi:ribokinase